MRTIYRKAVAGIAITVVFFAVCEVCLRLAYSVRNRRAAAVLLPYAFGDDYGPTPPWLEGLKILAPDKDLFWKNRPNLTQTYVDAFGPAGSVEERLALLRRFSPKLPEAAKGYPVWKVRLNSEGYRQEVVPGEKRATVFRVACLGDSWTFGMNVGQDQTYPRRLGERLQREYPGAEFEVLNFGVLGYTSYQGLRLLKDKVLDLRPDVVVIGFAMNDSKVAGYRDKDMAEWMKHPTLGARIERLLEMSESYKLLKYVALLAKHRPKSVGSYLKDEGENTVTVFEKLEPWTRVGLPDYEQNIAEMVRLAGGRGAGIVLLYNELWENGMYEAVLKRISAAESVPLVSGSALLADARRRLESGIEHQLSLEPAPDPSPPPGPEAAEVIFRVFLGRTPVPRAVYMVGPHPSLGALVPNRVAMYDDGTHGDQRAGDAVWSYSARLSPGKLVLYVYTNSGPEGKWEGLDVPQIRKFTVPGNGKRGKVYGPVESFGRIYMQADSWHADAEGYELIAQGVLEAMKGIENVKEYVGRTLFSRF